MTIEELRQENYGHHLVNILEHEQKERGLDISNENKLQRLADWWSADGADSGLMQYIRIKAKHNGEQKATFKESGTMVIDKFKELKG